jgi:LCP family protein required for cell wall assembly
LGLFSAFFGCYTGGQMDRHKQQKGPSKRAYLDGFVSDGRELGIPPPRAYRPQKGQTASPQLGSKNARTDGFHPLRQGSGDISHTPEHAEASALLNEPIVLADDLVSPKKKKKAKHPRARRRLKKVSLAAAAFLILGAAYFGVRFYMTGRQLFRGGGKAPALADQIDINQLKGEGDGRINVLLLGIGGPGHEGADLTDTIIIASIDPVNHKATLLSLPRDLWVRIPGDGYQKLNAAYAYGKEGSKAKTETGKEEDGLALLDKTLQPVLGIPIHYHSIIDFKAFKQLVDAVGGVDANVSPELTAHENFWIEGTRNQYYVLNVPAGQQHFDGTKALYFARERHNDSDFVRSQRQRLMITALKSKIFSAGTFSNPVKMSSLLTGFGSNVHTDFSITDLSRLYQVGGKISANNINSIDLVTAPHDFLTTDNIDGLSVVEPKAGLYNYDAIQSYVRNAVKDSFLAKENSNIAVYNATNIDGLATSSAAKLRSYGYNISVVDNAPNSTNPSYTTIVDLTAGKDKYTKHYLEQRFGVTAVKSLPSDFKVKPPAGTSFVIILGRDAANSSKTSV